MTIDTQPDVIPLWPNGAPGSEGWLQQEQETVLVPTYTHCIRIVRNVTQPTLTVFLPDPGVANGTTVIICPGGAFHFLTIDDEGTEVAQWLNARGVAAFVLKYRLIETAKDEEGFMRQVEVAFTDRTKMAGMAAQHKPFILADGQQAVKLVRQRASAWGIAPDRIGILGFSAGGAVTVEVTLQHDRQSRPSFAAAIYTPFVDDVPPPQDAPPLFVLAANDDPLGTSGSTDLYASWKAAGHPVELHIYAKGGHGFGMRKQGLPIDGWIERFGDWLQMQGLLDPRHENG